MYFEAWVEVSLDRQDLEACLAHSECECCSAFPLAEFCEKGLVWGSRKRMPAKEADAVQRRASSPAPGLGHLSFLLRSVLTGHFTPCAG